MKLYLSSFRMGNKTEVLKEWLPEKGKVGLCINALDSEDESVRKRIFDREKEALESLGFQVVGFDLKKYFKNKKQLKLDLSNLDLFWASGGNVFVLNLAMALSGFSDVIIDLLKSDSLVYGGYSAGACVAGKSLKCLDLVDCTDRLPNNYPETKIIWEGLKLVNYTIAPHYRSEHPESEAVESVVEGLKNLNIPYRALKDGEVIVVSTHV